MTADGDKRLGWGLWGRWKVVTVCMRTVRVFGQVLLGFFNLSTFRQIDTGSEMKDSRSGALKRGRMADLTT